MPADFFKIFAIFLPKNTLFSVNLFPGFVKDSSVLEKY